MSSTAKSTARKASKDSSTKPSRTHAVKLRLCGPVSSHRRTTTDRRSPKIDLWLNSVANAREDSSGPRRCTKDLYQPICDVLVLALLQLPHGKAELRRVLLTMGALRLICRSVGIASAHT